MDKVAFAKNQFLPYAIASFKSLIFKQKGRFAHKSKTAFFAISC